MGTTANYAIPYPELTDPPDGAGQMKALADRVDACLLQLARTNLAQVEQTVIQSIPSGAFTAITFDNELIDSSAMWAPSPNPTRIVAPVAGWYRLTGGISFGSNANGRRAAAWYVQGVGISTTNVIFAPTAASTCAIPATSPVVNLTAGQYVELRAFQDSSVAINTVISSTSRSFACVEYVRP